MNEPVTYLYPTLVYQPCPQVPCSHSGSSYVLQAYTSDPLTPHTINMMGEPPLSWSNPPKHRVWAKSPVPQAKSHRSFLPEPPVPTCHECMGPHCSYTHSSKWYQGNFWLLICPSHSSSSISTATCFNPSSQHISRCSSSFRPRPVISSLRWFPADSPGNISLKQ